MSRIRTISRLIRLGAPLLVAGLLMPAPAVAIDDNSVVVTVPPPPAGEPKAGTAPEAKTGQPAAKAKTEAAKPSKAARKTPAAEGEPEQKAAAKAPEAKPAKRASLSIAALVNDEPITAYEIEQRQRFLALNAREIQEEGKKRFQSLVKDPSTSDKLKRLLQETIDANKGKSKDEIIKIFEQRKKEFAQGLQRQAAESARAKILPGLRKQALEELIDERLKIQEAKRLNAVADDADVDRILTGMADRNKMTLEQFAAHLKGMGADINSMRSRFRAELSWREVVRRRFGHQVAITERDVDRMVASAPGAGEDEVALQVQRITLAIPPKLDQTQVAKRVAEADGLSAKFTGCANAKTLAAGIEDAKHEDLGTKKPSSIPEPTRTLLLNARDGEILPPSVAKGGVELWMLCGRTVEKADDKKREIASAELRQKEFEILAKKHLKDLRLDAAIEYR